MLVPGAATFAELLESELNCTNMPPTAGAWNRPLTVPLFVFARPQPVVGVGSVDSRSTASPLNAPRRDTRSHANPPTLESRTTPVTEPPTTRRIRLSAREQGALTALNDLGADLGGSLSPSTLRRAFRQLAHRYHPDRHPGASAAEQDRLARVFVDATEHYRVLAAALSASSVD